MCPIEISIEGKGIARLGPAYEQCGLGLQGQEPDVVLTWTGDTDAASATGNKLFVSRMHPISAPTELMLRASGDTASVQVELPGTNQLFPTALAPVELQAKRT